MFKVEVQNRVGGLVALSVFLVPVFVTPAFTTDPINIPKLWVLTTCAVGVLALLISQPKNLLNLESRKQFVLTGLFIFTMFITIFMTDAPLSQQFFGVVGRNTGFLSYFSLSIILLGVALVASPNFARQFMVALGAAAVINIVYGFFQSIGIEPMDWTSQYSPVIGTLGNPNFFSSFLGISAAFFTPFVLSNYFKKIIRVMIAMLICFAVYVVVKSDSIQGVLIFLVGIAITFYFFLGSRGHNRLVFNSYKVLLATAGLLGFLGIIKIGPLANFLYSSTLVNRIDYWGAGIKMFKEHPFFGIGLDSFGDWYRYYRSEAATLRSGPGTVTNTAHNVFIDLASTSGIFTLIAYLAILVLALITFIKLVRNNNKYDPFLIGIFVAWIAYLIQSAISINNLGLAIFGWTLPGLIFASKRWTNEYQNKDRGKKLVDPSRVALDFSSMAMILGITIGGVVGFLPFNADANFKHALSSMDANAINVAAKKWPQTSVRFNLTSSIFQQNADKVPELELSVARLAVKYNDKNFDSWNSLYLAKKATARERQQALEMMRWLDPQNRQLDTLK